MDSPEQCTIAVLQREFCVIMAPPYSVCDGKSLSIATEGCTSCIGLGLSYVDSSTDRTRALLAHLDAVEGRIGAQMLSYWSSCANMCRIYRAVFHLTHPSCLLASRYLVCNTYHHSSTCLERVKTIFSYDVASCINVLWCKRRWTDPERSSKSSRTGL